MILYTSGTTGRPKGVLHMHNSIHALIRQIGEHWKVVDGDAFLVPSPIAHIGGSIYAFECPLLLGTTTAVLMERWEPGRRQCRADARRAVHTHGGDLRLHGSGPSAPPSGGHPTAGSEGVHLRAAPRYPQTLIRRAADYFEKARQARVYGSTEVPVTTVGSRRRRPSQPRPTARAGIADVTLADGEIRARGPQMLVGYLHPTTRPAAFDTEGYFRTGDLARWVDGDYLVVTGRVKDIIIRNGENISPKEGRGPADAHPAIAIAEIAVVGVPDERTGERACAVIMTAGQPAPELADLRRSC